MIGWKKVEICGKYGRTGRYAILKLDIRGKVVKPDQTATVYPPRGYTRFVTKFRTDKLKVLEAFRPRTREHVVLKEGEFFIAGHVSGMGLDVKESSVIGTVYEYKVGRIQKPANKFNPSPSAGCAAGLHFFDVRANAENWSL